MDCIGQSGFDQGCQTQSTLYGQTAFALRPKFGQFVSSAK